MALTFAEEPYAAVIDDLMPLIERYYEAAAPADPFREAMPLCPNYSRYGALAAAGHLLVVTARHEGTIVGYCNFLVDRLLDSDVITGASLSGIWMEPEHRSFPAFTRLFDVAEAGLRARGVTVVDARLPADVAPLLQRRGFVPTGVFLLKALTE